MERLKEIAQFLRDVGFPIFVALWLLLRLDAFLQQVTIELVRLQTIMTSVDATLKKGAQ